MYSHQEKVTQWTHPKTGKMKRVPQELPHGWTKRVDKESGIEIFINHENGKETYIDPRLAFATEEASGAVGQIRQRFDASSKALQVLHGKDLNGKLAIITGANCGIGFETARTMAFHGCTVIFACRNKKSAEEAIQKIESERTNTQGKCRFMQVDLGSLRSTRAFIEAVKIDIKHIDYLILNAGVFGLPYVATEDMLETTFQVSHLSHFYIATELIPLLDHTSRVIVVSSESHRFANFPETGGLTEELLSPPASKYWSMMAYNNAKLCNVLFAKELAQRLQHKGISVFSLHPGNLVSTSLSRNWWLVRVLFAFVRPFTKSLQQAAATTIFCCTAEEITGLTGLYFNNCFVCEPSGLAHNDELSRSLWEISEKLLKEKLMAHN